MDDAPHSRPYASLLRRYQALVLDGVLYIVVFAAGVLVPELFSFGRFATGLCFGGTLAFLLSYEPLTVGVRGGTIGHFHYKIRVWDARVDRPIGVARAFGRAIVKGFLGVISLVLMLVTAKAQSLHDKLFHSIVVPADSSVATAADVFTPEQVPSDELPGPARRVLVIMAYVCFATLVVGVFEATLLSSECLQLNICNQTESMVTDVFGFAWLAVTLTVVVLGWRGRLLGCQRRQATPPAVG